MRYYLILLLSLFFAPSLSAQDFQGTIEYNRSFQFNSKADSIEFLERYTKHLKPSGLKYSHSHPYKMSYRIHQDTILAEKTMDGDQSPYQFLYQTNDESYLYNYKTGKKRAEKLYRPEFKEEFYSSIRSKLKEISGYDAQCYKASSTFKEVTIWVWRDSPKLPSNGLFKEISFKGKLILKKDIVLKKDKSIRTFQLLKYKPGKVQPIAPVIAMLEKRSDKEKMYQELLVNKEIPTKALELGSTAPNLSFKLVEDFKVQSLRDYVQPNKYIILEFWGTWCGPCLKATPKLKEFYSQHNKKIQMISFNYRDNLSAHVKEVIQKKQMSWVQAFGSEKLIEILNPLKRYPTIVLLDDQLKVLLIGNPHSDLEKVSEMIGG